MMKKGRLSVMLFVGCLSLVMAAGCAQKAAVKSIEDTQKVAVTDDQKRADAAAKEKAARDEAARQKALQDEALKKQAMGLDKAQGAANALADIFFDFDKFQIRPSDRDVLKKDAEWILKNKPARVIVEGHCDERGTTEYNLALGESRANETKKYLTSLGVEKDRLKVISYGEERPFAQGKSEEAWAKNRRAHFVVEAK